MYCSAHRVIAWRHTHHQGAIKTTQYDLAKDRWDHMQYDVALEVTTCLNLRRLRTQMAYGIELTPYDTIPPDDHKGHCSTE